jgi:hypothetical protein
MGNREKAINMLEGAMVVCVDVLTKNTIKNALALLRSEPTPPATGLYSNWLRSWADFCERVSLGLPTPASDACETAHDLFNQAADALDWQAEEIRCLTGEVAAAREDRDNLDEELRQEVAELRERVKEKEAGNGASATA